MRLRRDQVFYYKSKKHYGRRTLSIAFRFIAHDDEHQFALFYPYTPTTLHSYLNRLTVQAERSKLKSKKDQSYDVAKTSSKSESSALHSRYSIDQLCSSVVLRPIYSLSITDHEGEATAVFIIGRLHGNLDSISSYVCQGIIDFALCDHIVARAARKLMRLIVVPMQDPDSIIAGNTRSDIFGQSEMTTKIVRTNPNIYKITQYLLEQVKKSASKQRTIFVELRTNIRLIGLRTVSILYNNQLRMEKHLQLPRLLAKFIDAFYLEKCVFFEKGNKLSIPLDDIR